MTLRRCTSFWCFFFPLLASMLSNSVAVHGVVDDQVAAAIQKCRDKLSNDPTFPPAQFLLSKILASLPGSDMQEAADLAWNAGSCVDRPMEDSQRVEALCRAAQIYHELQQQGKAADAYNHALRILRDQESVEQLLHESTPIFIGALDKSSSVHSITVSNLAVDLVQKFPKSVAVHQFQGAVARKLGHVEDAYAAYHTATVHLVLDPTSIESLQRFVQSQNFAASAARHATKPLDKQLEYLNKANQAIGNYLQDEERINLKAEVLTSMGALYKNAGDDKEAISSFQAALKVKPGDGQATAHLASLDALPDSVDHLEMDYVRDLFDGYASKFEDELVNTLDYEGHIWVSEAACHVLQQEESCSADPWIIVDIGCGTGLVGEYLTRDLKQVSRILGVDLSQQMVQTASSRRSNGAKVYEVVEQADAVAFLDQQAAGSIKCAVAADVFVYIGNLESMLRSSHTALASGGTLIFSVELCSEEQGLILLPSGRFGHSKSYIATEATNAGFEMQLWKEGTLRKQRGENVAGALVVLRKTT